MVFKYELLIGIAAYTLNAKSKYKKQDQTILSLLIFYKIQIGGNENQTQLLTLRHIEYIT